MRIVTVCIWILTAGGCLAGCSTGHSPGYLTTASLPSFPKLAPNLPSFPQPKSNDPPRLLPAASAPVKRNLDGLGVAGPNGPKAPRYQTFQWNGIQKRVVERPGNAVANLEQQSPTTTPLSWTASPRMAPVVAEQQAAAMAQPATIQNLAIPSKTLVVRRGDTLAALARDHHTTMAQLLMVNGLMSATELKPGQILRIP